MFFSHIAHTTRTTLHLKKMRLPFDSMAMLTSAQKFVWRQLGVKHFSVCQLRLAHFFVLGGKYYGLAVLFHSLFLKTSKITKGEIKNVV